MGKLLAGAASCAAVLLIAIVGAAPAGGARAVAGPSVSAQVVRALARGAHPRVVVVLRPRIAERSLASAHSLVAAAQGRVVKRLGRRLMLGRRYRTVPALAGRIDRRGLGLLRSSPDVAAVTLDHRVQATLAQSVPLIRADQVQAAGYTGAGVTVAMLDTGVDTDHPDLADAITGQACFVTHSDGTGGCLGGERTAVGPGSAEDDEGHGTGVAGIITANAAPGQPPGVAPGASIVAVKVLGGDGSGLDSDILAGLDWVINERPDVDVVNMSFATEFGHASACDDTDDGRADASALAALRSRGVLAFAASGNEGTDSYVGEPACISSVVSVGAVYDAGFGALDLHDCVDATTMPNQVVCFSNAAPTLDLLAPGARIIAPALGGARDEFDGTSAAAPHATGVAALLLQRRPDLTPEQLETAMRETGVPVLDTRNNLTFRRVDALAALQSVAPLPSLPGPTFIPDADATFAEPLGDVTAGPDVGDVHVTTQRGIVSFGVRLAPGTSLSGFAEVRVFVDTDHNPSTGDAGGFDARLDIESESASLRRFAGGSFIDVRPVGGVTRAADQMTIEVSQQELGLTGDFSFRVTSRDSSGGDSDVAPASGRWSFPAFAVSVNRTGTGGGTVSGGGIACGNACSTFVGRGESITLDAAPAAGSAFLGWDPPCGRPERCTVVVDGAKALVARFEALRRLAVAKRGTGIGRITSDPNGIDCGARCQAQFANGTSVALAARAAAGSRFRRWSGACTGAGPCRVELDGAKTVSATFADVAAPTARPLSGNVRRGGRARLRFRLRDNSGRARATVTVDRAGRVLTTISRRLGPASGRVYDVGWRVPSGLAPGPARLCVRPVDGSKNAGARACATVRVV
jgi:Subtilase family/Divergent InlB B-repeat domain